MEQQSQSVCRGGRWKSKPHPHQPGRHHLDFSRTSGVFFALDGVTWGGGQRQRVGIARALMHKPKIILADEPVASLDPATARTILDILRRINREDGVTILCNLHLPELAREYGQRLIAMKVGEIVYDGGPEGLDSEGVDDLYGTPGSL